MDYRSYRSKHLVRGPEDCWVHLVDLRMSEEMVGILGDLSHLVPQSWVVEMEPV